MNTVMMVNTYDTGHWMKINEFRAFLQYMVVYGRVSYMVESIQYVVLDVMVAKRWKMYELASTTKYHSLYTV